MKDQKEMEEKRRASTGGIGVKMNWKSMKITSLGLENCFLIGPATFFIVDLHAFSLQANKIVNYLMECL
jgi:hypothetical protein